MTERKKLLLRLDPAVHDALAAIMAIGEVDTVCKGSVRRENRERIKELVALSGPAVPALKKVLADEAGAAAAA